MDSPPLLAIWKIKRERRIGPFYVVNSFRYLSKERFMSRRAWILGQPARVVHLPSPLFLLVSFFLLRLNGIEAVVGKLPTTRVG